MPYKRKSQRRLEKRAKAAEHLPTYHVELIKPPAPKQTPVWIANNRKLIADLIEFYENQHAQLTAELADLTKKRADETKRVEYMNLTPYQRKNRQRRQAEYRQKQAQKTA